MDVKTCLVEIGLNFLPWFINDYMCHNATRFYGPLKFMATTVNTHFFCFKKADKEWVVILPRERKVLMIFSPGHCLFICECFQVGNWPNMTFLSNCVLIIGWNIGKEHFWGVFASGVLNELQYAPLPTFSISPLAIHPPPSYIKQERLPKDFPFI